MTVSRRLRFEILRRDGHTCRYCGAKAPDVTLTVDHVVPVALGGGDDPRNLVTACQDCNSGKASVPADAAIVEDVDATAMLFGKAVERAADRRREAYEMLDRVIDDFRGAWDRWRDQIGDPVPVDANWRETVERLLVAGLDYDLLVRLIPKAMNSAATVDEKWRYFCGCCWRELTDIQEAARRLIEDGEV